MNYLKSIASFKTGTPPNVKEALDKQGDKQIISARIGRTPVASAITAMLKKLSNNVPYDTLFHLFIFPFLFFFFYIIYYLIQLRLTFAKKILRKVSFILNRNF